MPLYIENSDERILLDTAKAVLKYENETIDLTGTRFSMFDLSWYVEDGMLGSEDDAVPCKVVTFVDAGFTGMKFSIPIVLESAEKLGNLLIGKPPKKGLFSWLKKRS